MATSTEKVRQWRLAHPERWKAHQHAYRTRHRPRCRRCNTSIPYPANGRKYCSKPCLVAQRKENNQRIFRLITADFHEWKKNLGCVNCGYNKCGAALEFHHPQQNKERRIGAKHWATQSELIQREIQKCVLLCANCHKELHFEENANAV